MLENNRTCDHCGLPKPTKKAVIAGRFGSYCDNCRTNNIRSAMGSTARGARELDRDNHLRDIIQPYDRKGAPNQEFIRAYPDEAKEYFTQEQLENYG